MCRPACVDQCFILKQCYHLRSQLADEDAAQAKAALSELQSKNDELNAAKVIAEEKLLSYLAPQPLQRSQSSAPDAEVIAQLTEQNATLADRVAQVPYPLMASFIRVYWDTR